MQDVSISLPDGSFNVWHRDGSPTAVLIHGLTGTSRWWIPVISHLPDDMGLIALDGRGRGQSWQAPPPYDLPTLADDAAAALGHIGIDDAIVAGYSMGAWVAALMTIRHTPLVSRAVLIDGGLGVERDETLATEEALALAVGPSLARLDMRFESQEAYFDFWREHPAFVGRWRSEMEKVFAYELHRDRDGFVVRADREAIIEGGKGIVVDEEVRQSAARVATPTKLLTVDHGLMDQPGGFVARAMAEEAAEANPNLDVEHIEGLNHYTLMLGDGAPGVAAAIIGR